MASQRDQMNRHDRRKAAKAPRVMKIIMGGVEITITPSTIERVLKEWEADNPGKTARADMTPKEFGDRMMETIIANARPLPSGTA